MKKIQITKKVVWDNTKYFALLIILSFFRALATYVFIIPNAFAPGGIGGLATIIYNGVLRSNHPEWAQTWFDPGLWTLILNIPILIAAFCTLKKRFAFNTLCVVGAYSGFISLLGAVKCPQFDAAGDSGYMLLAAIAGGVAAGIGMGIMLRHNMCLGGTDIFGKIIYKYNPSADPQWWIFACDCVIAVLSGSLGFIGMDKTAGATAILTAVLSPIFYSFISLFATSECVETIQSGIQSSLVFHVISDHANEIANEISLRVNRGVTITKAIGHYTGQEHDLLICVVRKKQINLVKNAIKSVDPEAFIYITKAREVAGKGFHPIDTGE